MKKLLTVLLALSLLFMAGCNKKDPEPEVVVGGWEERVDQEVTEELLGIFNKGVEGTDYEGYVPVKFLATQLVSGMNFKFLCENGEELVIYQDLDGNYFALNPDGSKAEKKVEESVIAWDREGFFLNEADGEALSIYFAEGENDGMAVGYYKGDDEYSAILPDTKDKLEGILLKVDGSEEYSVNISKEGDNGILMIDKEGNEHHFIAMDMPEIIASVHINSEGAGQISYGFEKEDIVFDDEQPYRSGYINLPEPQMIVLGAKADEGHKFVKWTLNGEDYSTDEIIEVEVSQDSNFVALFE